MAGDMAALLAALEAWMRPYMRSFYNEAPDIQQAVIIRGVHAGDPDRSLGGKQNAVQGLRKGGFSGAVVPQDRHETALFNVKVQVVDGPVHGLHLLLFVLRDIVKHKLCSFDEFHKYSRLLKNDPA